MTRLSIFTISCMAVIIGAGTTWAAPIANDGFDVGGSGQYTAGDINTQGPSGTGIGWIDDWDGSLGGSAVRTYDVIGTNLPQYSSNGYVVPRVNPSGTPGSMIVDNNGGQGFGNYIRNFASTNMTGDIYFSMLIDAANTPSSSWSLNFRDQNGASRYLLTRGSGDNSRFRVGIDPLGVAFSYGADSTTETWDQAQFLVGRITGAGGTNAVYDLWINPTDLTDIDSLTPDATHTVPQTSFGIVGVRFGFANGDDGNTIDELRFGTSFDDVLVPEPASAGLLALAGIALLGRRRRQRD